MSYLSEEYTRHYIVQALFRLMDICEYPKIAVSDIVRKAGVGRATFYRYFKSKEDVIAYYFTYHAKEFVFSQHYYPRNKEDHIRVAEESLRLFREHKESFRLLQKANLSGLYLDFLNRCFAEDFRRDHPEKDPYLPYLYAGMLYNVSMKWLEDGCAEDPAALARLIVGAIYNK